MNKKGFIFTVGVLIVFISVMFTAKSILENKKGGFKADIGERQLELVKTAQQAENFNLFIDQFSTPAFSQSIIDLASKGGYSTTFPCGTIGTYTLWQDQSNQCYPDKNLIIKKNLKQEFSKQFSQYAKIVTNVALTPQQYDFFLEDKELLTLYGISLTYVEVPGKKNKGVTYNFKPNFKVSVPYNLSDYTYLQQSLKEEFIPEVLECEKNKNFLACVSESLEKLNTRNTHFEWKHNQECPTNPPHEERLILFCVTKKEQKIPYYDKRTNLFALQDVTYNFAAHIVNLPPEPISFEIINPRGEDNSLLFKWKKEKDIKLYTLYYSTTDFEGQDVSTVTNKKDIINNPQLLTKDPETCTFKNVENGCDPFLKKDTLYEKNNSLYYKFDTLEKNENYFFSIVATDTENNSLQTIENTKIGKTTDKLAPGKTLFTVSYNPDTERIEAKITSVETLIEKKAYSYDDFKHYAVFLLNEQKKELLTLKNLKQETSRFQDISLLSPGSGTYYVAILALDNNNNPYQKIATTAEKDGELIIKPEYEPILLELSNPQKIEVP